MSATPTIECNFFSIVYGFDITEEPCQTPSKAPGTCIPLKECDYLFNIIMNGQHITASDREYLRHQQCGYDGRRSPKVNVLKVDNKFISPVNHSVPLVGVLCAWFTIYNY